MTEGEIFVFTNAKFLFSKKFPNNNSCAASSMNRLIIPKSLTEVLMRSTVVFPNETSVSINEVMKPFKLH